MASMASHSPPKGGGNPALNLSLPFTTTTSAYANILYRDVVGDREVNEFVENTDTYDTSNGRWAMPGTVKKAEDLVCSAFGVLYAIFRHFVRPTDPRLERRLLDTTSIPGCGEEDGRRNCPAIVVQVASPSFELPWTDDPSLSRDTALGLTNIATYFVVKPEAEVRDEIKLVAEVGFYARQIFRRQSNRLFVRCMVLTEKSARLFHFDRSGTEMTPSIDIHKNPATLIRLVVGISSTRERAIGFDDSIRWTTVNGVTGDGTVTTVDRNGQLKTYPTVEQVHRPRACISAGATICWKVRDPETSEEYVVKDSWRSESHCSEHESLGLVRNIPGFAHMVSYEADRGHTRDFRSPSTVGSYVNRVFSRTMPKSYGKSLEFFASALQLVCAVRDAIAGHRRLVSPEIGILHRDISYNNILLGKDNTAEGERGVLIDLDMAVRATEEKPFVLVDHGIGTRPFQAIAVLRSFGYAGPHPPHDYLNELESFLYLITYIFLVFKPDGTPLHTKEIGSPVVLKWGAESPRESEDGKHDFLYDGSVVLPINDFVEETWGSACATLLDSLAAWVTVRTEEKNEVWRRPRNKLKEPNPFTHLHANIDRHYAEVLAIFDEAIEQLRALPATTPVLSKTEVCIASTSHTPSSTLQPATTTAVAHDHTTLE